MIVVTADAGGTKTTVALTDGDTRLIHLTGPAAAVRPGRALVSATIVADLIRSALAQGNRLRADVIVVGAAGAGRQSDAEEIRVTISRERIADRVVVVSDVALAFAAFGVEVGLVLVAGTGSVVIGRAPDGREVRQGGFGWQMGDEGAGYWIGQQALRAAGFSHDRRGPETALLPALMRATGAPSFRDLVGWSTVASPREVANLSRAVVATAAAGDVVAGTILERASEQLALLVNALAADFPDTAAIPVGFAGGLVGPQGPLQERVAALIKAPFVALHAPVNPLLGGPPLAA